MTNNIIKHFALLVVIISACKKPSVPPPIINEAEEITTLKLTFQNTTDSGAAPFEVIYSDKDGIGGNPPTADIINLKASKNYNVSAKILDETKNPTAEINPEIIEEGNDHQLFYRSVSGNINFSYKDVDKVGRPLGLEMNWQTYEATTAPLIIRVILKHQPGIKANIPGDINRGDTDIEVEFTANITK